MNNLPTDLMSVGKSGTASFNGQLVKCMGSPFFRGTVTFQSLGDGVSITEIRITEDGATETIISLAAEGDQPRMPRNFRPDWVDKAFSPFATARLQRAWHEAKREWVAHFGGDFHFHASPIRVNELPQEANKAIGEYYHYRRLTGAPA